MPQKNGLTKQGQVLKHTLCTITQINFSQNNHNKSKIVNYIAVITFNTEVHLQVKECLRF